MVNKFYSDFVQAIKHTSHNTEVNLKTVSCSSASNRIIGAKDHASIQINIAEVNTCIIIFKYYI